jgi:hypothetical protein
MLGETGQMHSHKVEIFFSCSFSDDDKPVNDLVLAVCEALDLSATNVSTGSALTPPDAAKVKIDAAQALVGVCTKRDELKNGGFVMPQAVHDEISFAYGKDIPVIMIVEEGVELKGFKANFGTYLSFNRSNLINPEFVGKLVEAIHKLKLDVIAPHQLGLAHQGIPDSHAEFVHHLVELKDHDDDYIWQYSTTKKLTFTKESKRAFQSSVWATLPPNIPAGSPTIEWSLTVRDSSRGLDIDVDIGEQTAECFRAMLRPNPNPEIGDYIEYSTISSSRYINPIWEEDALSGEKVHLENGDYPCADGLVFVHRTKVGVIEFRFAASYGIRKSDIFPFVASYTSSVDYEVPSELERTKLRIEEFAGNLIVRMEVDSPLPGHMYGLAWNPRVRPCQ